MGEVQMSRIFSPEELAKGFIPLPEDFIRSLRAVHEIMKEEATALIAGLHFGSTHPGRNDFDITSDIDILIVYEGKWKDAAYAAMMEMTSYAARRSVPLQIIPFERTVAVNRFHTVGEDFAHHLKWAAEHGGVINSNPLRHIVPHMVRWDASSYIMGKLSAILKGYVRHSTMSDEEQRRFLRKVFDVPAYLGRKVLWEMGEELTVDSKTQVGEAYDRRVGGRAACLFHRIQDAKAQYKKNVEDGRKDGTFNERTYRGYLLALERHIEDVIELLELNALALDRLKCY